MLSEEDSDGRTRIEDDGHVLPSTRAFPNTCAPLVAVARAQDRDSIFSTQVSGVLRSTWRCIRCAPAFKARDRMGWRSAGWAAAGASYSTT